MSKKIITSILLISLLFSGASSSFAGEAVSENKPMDWVWETLGGCLGGYAGAQLGLMLARGWGYGAIFPVYLIGIPVGTLIGVVSVRDLLGKNKPSDIMPLLGAYSGVLLSFYGGFPASFLSSSILTTLACELSAGESNNTTSEAQNITPLKLR